MVMEDNEQPPAPITEASAPQVAERPLWVLSRDEQRVLAITFVGGLASIVAGVCIVGGALALVRGLKALHYTLGILILLTALCIVAVLWDVYYHHAIRRMPDPEPRSRMVLIELPVIYAVFSILLLAWIGLAAGIH
jgi:hypothetical protein